MANQTKQRILSVLTQLVLEIFHKEIKEWGFGLEFLVILFKFYFSFRLNKYIAVRMQ